MMVDMDWQPSNRKLKQFSICAWLLVPMLAWWWQADSQFVIALAAGLFGLVLLAWWSPGLVRPLYLGVSLLALPIGWVVGELLLLLIYLGVFAPIGLVFRVMGRDALGRRLDRSRESYWEETAEDVQAKQYYQRY